MTEYSLNFTCCISLNNTVIMSYVNKPILENVKPTLILITLISLKPFWPQVKTSAHTATVKEYICILSKNFTTHVQKKFTFQRCEKMINF